MRAYHKGWQEHRPLRKESRRVKWYQGNEPLSIRLMFEGDHRRVNVFYTDIAKATEDYEAFIAGTLTTKQITERDSNEH